MPKISVVLPTYNGIKFIKQSIDSVLNQTFTDFELIIINDCSTDGTRELVEDYARKDARIRVFHNETNLKLPASLNKGFELAAGEFYTWTSDDNRYEVDALEIMAKALDENPNVGMVYCNCLVIDENDRVVDAWKLSQPTGIRTGNCIGACFMYRSEVANKVGKYDTTMFLAEDYDYWLRIYENYQLLHLSNFLYYYREHGESLTATKQREIHAQNARLWMRHMDFLVNDIEKFYELRLLFNTTLEFAAEEERTEIYKKLCKYSNKYRMYCWKKRLGRKVRQYLGNNKEKSKAQKGIA